MQVCRPTVSNGKFQTFDFDDEGDLDLNTDNAWEIIAKMAKEAFLATKTAAEEFELVEPEMNYPKLFPLEIAPRVSGEDIILVTKHCWYKAYYNGHAWSVNGGADRIYEDGKIKLLGWYQGPKVSEIKNVSSI